MLHHTLAALAIATSASAWAFPNYGGGDDNGSGDKGGHRGQSTPCTTSTLVPIPVPETSAVPQPIPVETSLTVSVPSFPSPSASIPIPIPLESTSTATLSETLTSFLTSTIATGQPTSVVPIPVSQISDGQPQAPGPAASSVVPIASSVPVPAATSVAPIESSVPIPAATSVAPIASSIPVPVPATSVAPIATSAAPIPVSQISDGQPQAPGPAATSLATSVAPVLTSASVPIPIPATASITPIISSNATSPTFTSAEPSQFTGAAAHLGKTSGEAMALIAAVAGVFALA